MIRTLFDSGGFKTHRYFFLVIARRNDEAISSYTWRRDCFAAQTPLIPLAMTFFIKKLFSPDFASAICLFPPTPLRVVPPRFVKHNSAYGNAIAQRQVPACDLSA